MAEQTEQDSVALLASAIRAIVANPILLADVRRGLLTFDGSPESVRRGLLRIAGALERHGRIDVTDLLSNR